MNAMMDYLSSLMTGGFVFIMMLGFYFNIGGAAVTQTFSTSVQENLTSVSEVIEHDFRKIGYRVSDSLKILVADSNNIVFAGDFNNTGSIGTVQYYISNLPPVNNGNPNARILFRVVNSQASPISNLGVTQFRLWYYNAQGQPTTVRSQIRSIKVALSVENSAAFEGSFASAYWERTIRPQNLR